MRQLHPRPQRHMPEVRHVWWHERMQLREHSVPAAPHSSTPPFRRGCCLSTLPVGCDARAPPPLASFRRRPEPRRISAHDAIASVAQVWPQALCAASQHRTLSLGLPRLGPALRRDDGVVGLCFLRRALRPWWKWSDLAYLQIAGNARFRLQNQLQSEMSQRGHIGLSDTPWWAAQYPPPSLRVTE